MKKIYKYEITNIHDGCEIQMPNNWNMLDLSYQEGRFCLWALVDLDFSPASFKFVGYATGQELPEDEMRRLFLKTVRDSQGCTWHIFVVLSPFSSEKEPVETVAESEQQIGAIKRKDKMSLLNDWKGIP